MALDPTVGNGIGSPMAGEAARTGRSPAVMTGVNSLGPMGTSSDAALRKKILDMYGPGMLAYYAYPELGPIIIKAAQEEVPEGELLARIRDTKWYRERSTAQRDWDVAKIVDPGSAEAAVAAKRSAMAKRAKTLGITVTEAELTQLATDAARSKLSDTEVDDLLFSYFDTGKASMSKGTLGGALFQVKKAYAQYGLPISDDTAASLAKQLVTGELDEYGLMGMLVDQTKARYPQMAGLLDQGITPKDYFAPIKETVAKTLELNPESIDIFDPKYSSVLNMPLYEVQKWARSQNEWRYTDQANQQANQVADYISRTFGKVAS